VDELITIGRQEIEIEALARMQDLSKRYHLGIRVDQVQLKNVNPPSQVQASFNEVNKAQQDRENAINIANGEYNKAVPKAKGEADRTIRGAEGYRFKRKNRQPLHDETLKGGPIGTIGVLPPIAFGRLKIEEEIKTAATQKLA
jgi:regulator of protease activity HflC (stomatin/prohibitin superfamily)